MLKNILRLMRPKHYIKNFLIFVSIFFMKQIFDINLFIKVLLGFAAFSLTASLVYIINDIKDVEADRKHEIKKYRPIASGKISIRTAWSVAAFLVILIIFFDWLACKQVKSLFILMVYVILNILYSIKLKNIPLIDISILVSGFLLRIYYGAILINADVSSWVYLTVMAASFYLGLGKRRNEITKNEDIDVSKIRGALKYYNKEFLDKNMYMCMSLAIIFYSLWSTEKEVIARYNTDKLIWTVPILILLAMKYSLDIEMEGYADPVDVITGDKVILIVGILYAMLMCYLIYFS